MLGELDKKLESVRDAAVSDPTLLQEEKSHLRKSFDLGIRLIRSSGLQGVKGFGLSSREIRAGYFSQQNVYLLAGSFRVFMELLGQSAARFLGSENDSRKHRRICIL